MPGGGCGGAGGGCRGALTGDWDAPLRFSSAGLFATLTGADGGADGAIATGVSAGDGRPSSSFGRMG